MQYVHRFPTLNTNFSNARQLFHIESVSDISQVAATVVDMLAVVYIDPSSLGYCVLYCIKTRLSV